MRRETVGKQNIMSRLTPFGVHLEPPLNVQQQRRLRLAEGDTEGEGGGTHAQLSLSQFDGRPNI